MRNTALARIGKQRQRLRARQVHDVNGRLELFSQADEQGNGFDFGVVGTRCEERGVLAPVRIGSVESCRGTVDGTGKFGVRQQRQAAAAQTGERRAQVSFVDPRKTIDAGVDQEAFESRHAGRGQGSQRVDVAAHYAAPGGPVHPGLAARGLALAFQGRHIDDLRRAVERHVDKRGHSAGGGGACCRRKAFPVRAARLVDMHMRVHQSGQQYIIAEVVEARDRRHFIPSADTGNAFVLDQHSGGREASGREHAGGSEGVCHTVFTFAARGGLEQVERAPRTQPGISAPRHRAGHGECARRAEAARSAP